MTLGTRLPLLGPWVSGASQLASMGFGHVFVDENGWRIWSFWVRNHPRQGLLSPWWLTHWMIFPINQWYSHISGKHGDDIPNKPPQSREPSPCLPETDPTIPKPGSGCWVYHIFSCAWLNVLMKMGIDYVEYHGIAFELCTGIIEWPIW